MNKIFQWSKGSDWLPTFRALFEDLVTTDVYGALQDDPSPIYTLDDTGPIDRYLRTPSEQNTLTLLGGSLSTAFSHIRTFHACRTRWINSYFVKGLIPADYQRLFRATVDLFVNETFPSITPEAVKRGIESLSLDSSQWRSYVAMDERLFPTQCGHYLIHGSERVMAIAVRLEDWTGYDCLSILRATGSPTVLVIDIPLDKIDAHYRSALAGYCLGALLQTMTDSTSNVWEIDFTISFTQALPPDYTVDHYHPTVINDPHNLFAPYTAGPVDCDRCAT